MLPLLKNSTSKNYTMEIIWNTAVTSTLRTIIFLRFYLFIFRERDREGEREGEKHQYMVASHAPPTGGLAHNPGTCPDWESDRWPFGSQASAQSTEPHQPGLRTIIFKIVLYIKTMLFSILIK